MFVEEYKNKKTKKQKMKNYFKIITILSLFIIFACSKDEMLNTAPKIEAQSFNALEDITSSSIIGRVTATDAESAELSYSIVQLAKPETPLMFEISSTGDIKLAAGVSLDYRTAESHLITVEASDGELTASATVTINVVYVNSEGPVFTQSGPFTVEEDADETTIIGTMSATDADGDTLEFLISSSSLFKIDTNSGAISLKSTSNLDFETKTQYNFQITAFDGLNNVSTPVIINVTNVNEAPVFVESTKSFTAAEDIAASSVIGTVEATDPDNNNLSFSLTAANNSDMFTISNSGEISLAPGKTLDYETATSHSISVAVSDGGFSVTGIVVLTVTDVAEGASVNIPDALFKAALVNDTAINTNNDSEIQVTEAIAYTGGIYVSHKNISDLTGIEAFVNINTLLCSSNYLSSLDVSKNTGLTMLHCFNNALTSLDISKNIALTDFNCKGNTLTSLDVSKNTALSILSVNGNKLANLDISKNTMLLRLFCEDVNLTSLDISNNTLLTELRVYKNKLTSIDVSNHTALSTLSVSDNDLTSLDVSNNTALSVLYCAINNLTSLDVSNNTALTRLRCFDNNLTDLDISNGNNSNLWDFMADSNTSLTCIKIDTGFTPPVTGWVKDAGASYNITCPSF